MSMTSQSAQRLEKQRRKEAGDGPDPLLRVSKEDATSTMDVYRVSKDMNAIERKLGRAERLVVPQTDKSGARVRVINEDLMKRHSTRPH